METLRQDIRYGMRSLRKTPSFTIIATITLALGIGVNAAMFSIVNGVLLRPLSYPESDRLLMLSTSTPQFHQGSVSYPNFLDWRERSRSFERMAAYREDVFNLTGLANPERLRGLMTSATIFPTLGLNPVLGRTFTPDEDRRGGVPVVLLTSNFWKSRFGASPAVLGSTITLSERLYTVIGVIPSDDLIFDGISIIVPIGQWTEPMFLDRGVAMGLRVVGRLKAGVTAQQAESELTGIAGVLAREYPKENKNSGIDVVSLSENMLGDARRPLMLLLGAVGFVLLISCANVANLLLARGTGRRREFAVRVALGAQRGRILRQLMIEGLMLGLAGAALGLAVAWLIDKTLLVRLTNQLARADLIHLDGTVIAFTVLVSIFASLLFSIAPSLQTSQLDLNETLKEGGRSKVARHGFQRALVSAEVALALVLTVAAGLMIRTMSQLWTINPGFDPEQVLTFGIAGSPAVHGTPAAVRSGYVETMERLRAVPGVQAASVVMGAVPFRGDSEVPYWVEGRAKPAEQSQMDLALLYGVDYDYIKIMRIPLLRGRFLSAQDRENKPCVMAIDEEFQRKAFPGQDPIGQHINLDLVPMQCEIVGVVGHVRQWGLDSDATSKVRSQMYIEFRQFPDSVMDLVSGGSAFVLRSHGNPYALTAVLKKTVNDINGKMVLFDEESMHDVIRDSLLARRFLRLLLAAFAVLALVLAAVGMYGVVSYFVGQSTHDIGVRMALGAGRSKVLALILRDALRMASIGILIGAGAGFVVTRIMRNMLFGVGSGDPLTFVAVAALLAGVAVLASYLPALRATKVDPIVALRCE
ncbi:MAG TPA: ABC transporter permease [Terriglobales bacterium]|nr:ABC transporter permease [Terriglobales bacterium]